MLKSFSSCYGASSVFCIYNIINKEMCLDILEHTMVLWVDENMPLKSFYQHDNYSKDSRDVMKSCLKQNWIDVPPLPSRLLDRNPIGNLWLKLKDKIKGNNPPNWKRLRRIVQHAWYFIPIEKSKKLSDSMPYSIDAIL